MNSRSIHFRLTLWATLIVLLTSIAFSAQTYYTLQHSLYAKMRSVLTKRVTIVRAKILPNIKQMSSDELYEIMRRDYFTVDSSRFMRISKKDGTLLFLSDPPADYSYDPGSIPRLSYSTEPSEHYATTASGKRIFVIGVEASAGGDDYILEMGSATTQIDSVLHKLIATLIFGMPLVSVFTIAGGSILVRRALQPVEHMRATAEQISFGNLRNRLPEPATNDAIQDLSQTLNQMLERLDQAYKQASRFSADASHELRTPIAVIRAELETLAKEPAVTGVVHERIGSILEETERLSAIVEGLFSLARLDAGEAKVCHKPIDLAEAARATVEQIRLLAEEKNISIQIEASEPVIVMGDVFRLRQAIVNLFDNAVKYTKEGGSITVCVRAVGTNALLSFKDTGIGITADALPHIFERFYRADAVRFETAQGAGLGLSIVKSICQAHGGKTYATSQEGVGTTVTLEFPAARQIAA